MPMPKTVCRTILYSNIVQLEVCRTFSGRGIGMNITARERDERTDTPGSVRSAERTRRSSDVYNNKLYNRRSYNTCIVTRYS